MGLLDQAFQQLGGNQLPLMNAKSKLLQAALALIADNGQIGGLQGLLERFKAAGLENVISSWIGSGANVPITGVQLRQALGDDQVSKIAADAGMGEQEATDSLSEMLPDLVDRLTPSGHIPQGGLGDMSKLVEHFLGGFR